MYHVPCVVSDHKIKGLIITLTEIVDFTKNIGFTPVLECLPLQSYLYI